MRAHSRSRLGGSTPPPPPRESDGNDEDDGSSSSTTSVLGRLHHTRSAEAAALDVSMSKEKVTEFEKSVIHLRDAQSRASGCVRPRVHDDGALFHRRAHFERETGHTRARSVDRGYARVRCARRAPIVALRALEFGEGDDRLASVLTDETRQMAWVHPCTVLVRRAIEAFFGGSAESVLGNMRRFLALFDDRCLRGAQRGVLFELDSWRRPKRILWSSSLVLLACVVVTLERDFGAMGRFHVRLLCTCLNGTT